MTDFANLVMAVDATSVDSGAEALDRLTAAGTRAAGVGPAVANSTRATGMAAARMAQEAQAATAATVASANGIARLGNTSKMAVANLSNLTFQINDVVSGLAMGQAPMQILTQQGGQFYQIIQQSGLGARGFAAALLEMSGVLKVTGDAEAFAAAASAKASADSIRARAAQAASAIAAADTELALAQAAVRTASTSTAAAAAQVMLADAHKAVTLAAADAAIAENALTTATMRELEASRAAAASRAVGLGRVGVILSAAVIPATMLAAAFSSIKAEAGSDAELKQFAASLGLTRAEMKKLDDVTVTWGDTTKATFQILAERAGISGEDIKQAFGDAWKWIGDFGKFSMQILLASFAAMVKGMASLITNLAKVIANAFMSAVNAAIGFLEGLMNKAIDGVNALGQMANSVLGKLPEGLRKALGATEFENLAKVSLGRMTEAFDVSNPLSDMKDQFYKTFEDVGQGFDAISQRARDLAEARIKAQADELKADRTPKKDAEKKAKEVKDRAAEALAALDAQIKAQWELSIAYRESDAAAMRAEAMARAEAQAQKTKGEVALFYEKELALAVATRAADASKTIRDLEEEAKARKWVNDMVADGTIPASQAARYLEIEAGLRPLLAAYANAEGKEKDELTDIMGRYTQAMGKQNRALDEEARLRQLAGNSDEIKRLRLEAELLGASNRERAVRLAQLDAENFIRDNNVTDPTKAAEVRKSYEDAALATNGLAEAQYAYNLELTRSLDMLNLMVEQTQTVGTLLGSAFGEAGGAIGGLMTTLASYQAQQQEIADWKREETKKAGGDAVALANIEAQSQQKSKNAQIQATATLLRTAKGLFKEHSAGYQAMAAAEKAYAIIQTVAAIKSMAAGAAKMFAQLGVYAFPAVAAMAAVLAGFGIMGARNSGTATPPEIPVGGTGTVLGDPTAQSESISRSLELMSKNSTKGLEQGTSMVQSLRAIRDGIGELTAAVARSLSLSGGFFDTEGKLGTKSKGIQGFFGSTTTKSLYDQGLRMDAASLSDILAKGFTGVTYQVIEKVKKSSGVLGIGGGTKTSYKTSKGEIDTDITRQFQLITQDLYQSVVDAAKIFGLDVGDALKNFEVEIGKISFKGMTSDQIQSELQAVFSKLGDQMAGFAVEGLAEFQKAGEGLYETLMRIAKNYMTVDQALKSIGISFGAVGASSIKMRESLVKLMGGIDEFVSKVNFYFENFLTTAEQTSFLQTQVEAAFAGMGISVPDTLEAFKALVMAQDLTTEAGQALFAQLMAIAPAFYNLETAAEQAAAAAAAAAAQLAKQRTALQIELLTAQGKASEALALKRQAELDAMDASLRGLQQQVWAEQDLAKAKDNLVSAYKRESSELQATIDKFRGFSTELRLFRDSLLTSGSGGNSYQQTLVQLMKQAGLANTGDEGALGGGLTGAAQSFLEAAAGNAGSLQDLQRARAMVTRYIDSAIGVADGKVSVAEQQLAQMKTQVGALVDINESVQTVAQAIQELKQLMPGAPGNAPAPGTGSGVPARDAERRDSELRRHRQKVEESLSEILAATEQGTIAANQTARVFRRSERNGALAVVTDIDAPLKVEP